jgi:hypothetical protein
LIVRPDQLLDLLTQVEQAERGSTGGQERNEGKIVVCAAFSLSQVDRCD